MAENSASSAEECQQEFNTILYFDQLGIGQYQEGSDQQKASVQLYMNDEQDKCIEQDPLPPDK